ncbi:MAG: site-specific integrase, partial [Polyangiaceae bacterium]|nr:site-specific integrase [Polyangiaceae bacterium]
MVPRGMVAEAHLLADDWLAQLRVERGLSPRTVTAYATDLAKFFGYLEREGVALEDVTHGVISGFLVESSQSGITARSQGRYLSALSGFFAHLAAERHLRVDP